MDHRDIDRRRNIAGRASRPAAGDYARRGAFRQPRICRPVQPTRHDLGLRVRQADAVAVGQGDPRPEVEGFPARRHLGHIVRRPVEAGGEVGEGHRRGDRPRGFGEHRQGGCRAQAGGNSGEGEGFRQPRTVKRLHAGGGLEHHAVLVGGADGRGGSRHPSTFRISAGKGDRLTDRGAHQGVGGEDGGVAVLFDNPFGQPRDDGAGRFDAVDHALEPQARGPGRQMHRAHLLHQGEAGEIGECDRAAGPSGRAIQCHRQALGRGGRYIVGERRRRQGQGDEDKPGPGHGRDQ